MKKERKYFSEFGLNMVNGLKLLLQQEQLHMVKGYNFDPHIYMVCRRPRITIDPKTVKISKTEVTAVFRKQVKDKFIDIPIKAPNYLGTHDVEFLSEYPYTEYKIIAANGEIIGLGKSALLLSSIISANGHTDLEVLYIGQSYGKDGSRNAADRLIHHSTLQGIYSEAIQNSPDQDIWLVLSDFETVMLMTFDGTKGYQKSWKEDKEHTQNIMSSEMTKQQKINFTEAALIKYFRPEYNKTYKNTFPNPAHSSYSECYDLDLNMICVELQTEDLNLRLWSNSIEPKWMHFCSFPLHSKEDRVYMFDYS